MNRLRGLPTWVGVAVVVALGPTLPIEAAAQVRVSGSASLSGDGYSQTGLAFDRKSPTSMLLTANVNVTFSEQFTLPLSFYVSSETTGYQHPFNQIGASPRWSWGQAHAGYFSTRFSEFTLESARLLGAGVEMNPGPVRLAAVSGISQRAADPDSLLGRRGLFQQRMSAIQLGVGAEDGARFWITALQADDDQLSLAVAPSFRGRLLEPQENLVGSVQFTVPVGEVFSLDGEVAGSAYSGNIDADLLNEDDRKDIPSFLDSYFTPRKSSRADFAAKTAIHIEPSETFTLDLGGRLVGPGYKSLGSSQIEADVLDFTVAPSVRTPTTTVDVTLGRRQNNVADTRSATTSRTIVNANMMLRPSSTFSLSAQFTNYGLRSDETNDTLKVSNVNRLVSITPAFRFQSGDLWNDVQVGYTYQGSSDENVVTGRFGDTRSHNGRIAHTLSFPSGLSFTTSGMAMSGLSADIETQILSISEAVGVQLLDRRLRVNGSAGYSRTTTVSVDTGIRGAMRVDFRVRDRQQIQAGVQYRRFDYGVPRGNSTGYREIITRLGYSVTF